MTDGSARVDAWLWAVRVYKTRSAATTACRAGHVRVNGDRAKAAQPVRPGDELRVRIAGFDRILVVRQPISKRVGAVLAAAAVEDTTPPAAAARADARSCRCATAARDGPTKRERRDIDKLRGRDAESDVRTPLTAEQLIEQPARAARRRLRHPSPAARARDRS